jgi:hypothetical protein
MTDPKTAAIVDLNLLPIEHRPAQVSGLALGIAGVLALLLLASVPLAFRMEAARVRADDMQALASGADFELQGVEAELAQQRALRVEIDTANADFKRLESELAFRQGGARALHEDLFWLHGMGFLPAGSRLTEITATEMGFRVVGVTGGVLDGIAYAQNLVEKGGFPEARMVTYAPGDSGGGSFTVEVTR